MATWLTHLRVADKVADSLNIQNFPLYFVGSIAPDNDFPADCSHWCTNGDKKTCSTNKFYDEFVRNRHNKEDVDFYLGYYVHLCTDVYWQKEKLYPLQCTQENIRELKEMWGKVDTQFMCEMQVFRPFVELGKAGNLERQWLPYMDMNTVKYLVNRILDYTPERKEMADRCANQEIKQFIIDCSNTIISGMREL